MSRARFLENLAGIIVNNDDLMNPKIAARKNDLH
jgi:hypothetical protein